MTNDILLLYIILGALQGFLEWLPISSSAQVTILGAFLGLKIVESLEFAFFLHIASGFAALFYLRNNVREIIFNDTIHNLNSRLAKLSIATLISFLIALPVDHFLMDFLENLDLNSVMCIIGILLIVTGILMMKGGGKALKEEPTFHDLIVAGILQGFSILPGISRSGITFSALLIMGVKEDKALIWSYIMGIPAVIAAGFYNFLRISFNVSIICIVSSALMAFVFGILSIDTMLRLSRKMNYEHLTISLGILYIILFIFSLLFQH